MVALMDIGGGDVQFLDIAFLIGTGMLFVTEFVEAVFLCPAGIFIFTRCGLTADLSFFIDFYGLALFAAGGLNNGGVNDSSGCFLYNRGSSCFAWARRTVGVSETVGTGFRGIARYALSEIGVCECYRAENGEAMPVKRN